MTRSTPAMRLLKIRVRVRVRVKVRVRVRVEGFKVKKPMSGLGIAVWVRH